ncbi:MAG TPA: YkgJ family cysteine cluster protein [Phycisphaerae bacterium]|nr:YkgJ family cysteine cluster protein [Phycisphaerae bacterium]
MLKLKAKTKWYAAGLHFECSQCGNCCSGPPGYVWVTKGQIKAIAEFLGREDGTLDKSQLRRVGLRYSLTERPGGDCIFLKREGDKAGCSIYPVRPTQCRTWPFWSENLRSSDGWNRAALLCPGMNVGRHYSFVAIEELRVRK